MANPNTSSSFISWNMSDEESINSRIFSGLNLMGLQNEIATLAEQKINLIIDVNNPNEFFQTDAYIRGKLDMLRFILDEHHQAVEILNSQNYQEGN